MLNWCTILKSLLFFGITCTIWIFSVKVLEKTEIRINSTVPELPLFVDSLATAAYLTDEENLHLTSALVFNCHTENQSVPCISDSDCLILCNKFKFRNNTASSFFCDLTHSICTDKHKLLVTKRNDIFGKIDLNNSHIMHNEVHSDGNNITDDLTITDQHCNAKHGLFKIDINSSNYNETNTTCISILRHLWSDNDKKMQGVCTNGTLLTNILKRAPSAEDCKCNNGYRLLTFFESSGINRALNVVPKCIENDNYNMYKFNRGITN